MFAITCIRCGESSQRAQRTSRFCLSCATEHGNEQKAAIAQVVKAKRTGSLLPASCFLCVDCGKQARDYDHRDYTRPLDIAPVCRTCNQRRGPALDSQVRSIPVREAA